MQTEAKMKKRNWVPLLLILHFCFGRTCLADCPVVRDYEAIKGTVLNITTFQEFFDRKYKEYQDVVTNHPESRNSDIEAFWESMKISVYSRKDLVLSVSVSNKRKFTFECVDSKAKGSDPIAWKGEWEPQKSNPIQLVLYSKGDYPKIKTEVTYLLQQTCCDTGPINCMFSNIIPIIQPEEMKNICH